MGNIPHSDAEFDLWQDNYVEIVQTKATDFGIPVDEVTKVTDKQAIWVKDYGAAKSKNNRDSGDVKAKDDAKADYTATLRAFTKEYLAHNHLVTDADRLHLGITVQSGTHTPVAEPTTAPVATIDFSVLLQHSLSFIDSATPTSKAKPYGVNGAEVWRKMSDGTDYIYLGTCTRTPYTVKFADSDAAKTASYKLRWVNTKGQQGPWSAVVSSLVVG